MKRYIILLLCAALLLCVTACGDDTSSGADTSVSSTTQSVTSTTTVGESTTTVADGTDATTTTTTGGSTASAPTGGTTTAPSGGSTSAVTTAPAVTGTPSSTTTGKQPISTTSTTVTTAPTVAQPNVVLPAVGSDIDVTKQKDRIRVYAASATYNGDGTIEVSLTVKNHSTNWITEETDYIEYTCYDKNGNVVQSATKLNLGCIDTKKHPVVTYTFTVPADTAEVKITRSKITYWTEWS